MPTGTLPPDRARLGLPPRPFASGLTSSCNDLGAFGIGEGRLGEVAWVTAKLGLIGFGGPAAHLALMREETIVRRNWVGEQEFLDLLGSVSVLSGPTSTQVGMLLGRRRAGWAGLVVGGACFIAPATVIVGALAWAYTRWGTTSAGRGLLYGIRPVVIAIIAQALWGLARSAVNGRVLLAAGGLAGAAAYLNGVNVLIVMGAVGGAVTAAGTPCSPSWEGTWPATTDGSPRTSFLDVVAVGQFTPGPVFTTATFIGYLSAGVGGAVVATVGIFTLVVLVRFHPSVTWVPVPVPS